MKNTKTTKNHNIQFLGIAVALLALSGGVASAQFSVLHSFTGGADGANPYYDAPVVSGSTLYGTANQGAAGGGNTAQSHGRHAAHDRHHRVLGIQRRSLDGR